MQEKRKENTTKDGGSSLMSNADEQRIARRLGIRLRELRRRRHLTQAVLADALGIRQSPLSLIETGHHIPSGRLLYRLAEVLGVSVDALFADPHASESAYIRVGSSEGMVLRRRPLLSLRSAHPAPDVDSPFATLLAPLDPGLYSGELTLFADRIGDLASAFLALEDACGSIKRAGIPLILPFEPTEPGIEKLVGQVRYFLGIGHAVIFDYLELLENAGLRVIFMPLPGEMASCAAYDHANGNVFLLVSDGLTVERRLFRLIFELGRVYYFTRAAGSGQAVTPAIDGELDELHAARKFAALFLMPADSVRATVRQLGVRPDGWTWELLIRIKHRFGVSLQAFAYRLLELGLIDRTLSEQFHAEVLDYYEQHGYVEPGASRRILTPNGRLGDLRLLATQKRDMAEELDVIDALFERLNITMP